MKGNITDELIDKILGDLAGFPKKIKKINLFGFEESLCHPKFPEIIGTVNRAGVADTVEFTTNGVLPMFSGVDYGSIDENINNDVLDGRMHVHPEKINTVCHRAFYRMRVRSNGDVTATCCDATQDVEYGNVWNDSLYHIWNGEVHRAFLQLLLEGKSFDHPYCKGCMMPNDITMEADLLDSWVSEVLERLV